MYAQAGSVEQRKSMRYLVGGNAYALLKQPHYKELGRIIDISQTGISFLCINQGDWESTSFEIDIFLGHEKNDDPAEQIILKNIPLQPISYCRDNQDGPPAERLMRRCGVAFGELSLDQQARLDLFILRHGFANA